MGTQNPLETVDKEKINYVDFPKEEKEKLIYDLEKSPETTSEEKKRIEKSLTHIALCHNVIKEEDGYTSSSPDELALVNFASYIGYTFLEKDDNNIMKIKVDIEGK